MKRRRGLGGRAQRKDVGFEKGRGKADRITTGRKRPRGKEKEGSQPKKAKCVSPAVDKPGMEGAGRVSTGRNLGKLSRKKHSPRSESCVLMEKAKELWEKLRRCVCVCVCACDVCICIYAMQASPEEGGEVEAH